jgi:VIT1/CCC1 family predicted Fe2+/Mn2+ transporter
MTIKDRGEGSSRIEREVLEILERAESQQTPVEHVRSVVRRQGAAASTRAAEARNRSSLSRFLTHGISQIVGALILAVFAAVVSDSSRIVALLLAVASAVVFFSLWIPGRSSSGTERPRWRGQDLRGPGP